MSKEKFIKALDYLALIFFCGVAVLVLGGLLVGFIMECIRTPVLIIIPIYMVCSFWFLTSLDRWGRS